MRLRKTLIRFPIALLALGLVPGTVRASSHREAPAIAEDQFADNTDVYAFISPSDPNRIVLVANYVPLLLPASGPNFYRFSDSVLYEIKIDNDGDAVADLSYQFQFQTSVQNGGTFLYNTGPVASITDANLNVRQSYTLTRRNENTRQSTTVGTGLPVAPWFVGSRTFPGTSYDTVATQAVQALGTTTVFAGPRDEPFFVDLHVFDLLGVAGAPTTDGVNVMSIVLEVPITEVANGGVRPAAGSTGPTSVIGVYATASRREVRILRRRRGHDHQGPWMQVSRLGWPLVNEVLIPLQDKDNFNRTNPVDDVANFGSYILNPALPGLLNAVLGTTCSATPAGGRIDIVGLLAPNGTTAADLLRINISTGQTNADSHFPNGRALADDVTDTELTVLCNNGSPLGDGVNANDLPFLATFPYVAAPHPGN